MFLSALTIDCRQRNLRSYKCLQKADQAVHKIRLLRNQRHGFSCFINVQATGAGGICRIVEPRRTIRFGRIVLELHTHLTRKIAAIDKLAYATS